MGTSNLGNENITIKKCLEMADQLDSLQETKNEGRGVNCVRAVIDALRQGNYSEAKAIANNEHDKITRYPDIETMMEGFGLSESYATFNARWEAKLKGLN